MQVKIIFLSVLGLPVIYVPRTYYSLSSGSSVTLEVNVTSFNDITDLFWEKRNISSYIYEPIDVQSESRLKGGNISCPSLTITDVYKIDKTYFRVKATNRDGTSTGSSIYIYVFWSMYFNTLTYFNLSILMCQVYIILKEFIPLLQNAVYFQVISYHKYILSLSDPCPWIETRKLFKKWYFINWLVWTHSWTRTHIRRSWKFQFW